MNPLALLAGWFLAVGLQTIQSAPVTSLAFSPDGSALVSGGHKKLFIHSPTNGLVLRSVECPLIRISSIGFHPEGEILAAAGGTPGVGGKVLIIDWRKGKELLRFTNFSDLATSLAFNSTGTLLATASADHTIQVLRFSRNPFSATRAFTLKGHAGPVLTVAFSPDGKLLVSGSADRSLKVWSMEDGKLIRSFNHHTEAVHILAFRPQVKSTQSASEAPAGCASGSDDQTVRIWQPGIGRMVRIIRHHEGPILTLGFSPDGRWLFSAGREGIVRRLDPDSDVVVGEWMASDDWIYTVAVHPRGGSIATGDWAGKVKVWDLSKTGRNEQGRREGAKN